MGGIYILHYHLRQPTLIYFSFRIVTYYPLDVDLPIAF